MSRIGVDRLIETGVATLAFTLAACGQLQESRTTILIDEHIIFSDDMITDNTNIIEIPEEDIPEDAIRLIPRAISQIKSYPLPIPIEVPVANKPNEVVLEDPKRLRIR